MPAKDLLALKENWDGKDAPPLLPHLVDLGYRIAEHFQAAADPPTALTPNNYEGVDLEWRDLNIMVCFENQHMVLLAEFQDESKQSTTKALIYNYEAPDLDIPALLKDVLRLAREGQLVSAINDVASSLFADRQ